MHTHSFSLLGWSVCSKVFDLIAFNFSKQLPRTEIQLFFVWGAMGKSVSERSEQTFLGDPVYLSFVISRSESEIDFGKSNHKSTF